MEPSHPAPGLLTGLKALADETRLNILALLSQAPHTGEQLATLLDLRPSTISHHLARLKRAGLVRAQAESYYSVYHLQARSLHSIALRLASPETLSQMADSLYEQANARMRPRRARQPNLASQPARRQRSRRKS